MSVAISPSDIDFGTQMVNTTSAPTTVTLTNTSSTPGFQLNWSADNSYLSVGEANGNAGLRYTLWSAADLRRADMDKQITYRAGVWSPRAHHP